MKRFIISACAIIAAAVLVLSVSGRKSEQAAELFTDNIEALTDSETGSFMSVTCLVCPNPFCLFVLGPYEFKIDHGVVIS